MPNENNFEPKHVILPVVHPSGDIHNIAVPENTPLPELHDALVTAGYHTGWAPYMDPKVDPVSGRPVKGPNPKDPVNGAVEYDPKFRDALSKVWGAAGRGANATESGTYVGSDLERGPIATSNTEGRMSLQIPATAPYSIHSHPNHMKDATTAGTMPSGVDAKTAHDTKKMVYVVSRGGLTYVTPTGETGVVYSNPKDFEGK